MIELHRDDAALAAWMDDHGLAEVVAFDGRTIFARILRNRPLAARRNVLRTR